MDLAKLPNRGVYDPPSWVQEIKLYKMEHGDFALAYPEYKNRTAAEFIQVMQSTPAWESAQAAEGEEVLMDEGDEVLVDEAADLLDPVLPQEPAPTMDPATPAFKRAAVVKIDPEKKPFDFMSNRPVPRAKPVETEKVEETLVAEEPTVESFNPAPSRFQELTSAFESSRSAVNDLRHTVLEHRANRLADDIAALRRAAHYSKPSSSTAQVEELKWRRVPITDPSVKFAVSLCLASLEGSRTNPPAAF